MRGWLHLGAFFVAAASALTLLLLAPTGRAIDAAVYGASLLCLFGVSAVYHRVNWKRPTRRWIRRLDHATIYVFIAGTGTGLAAGLPPGPRHLLMASLWAGGALGVLRVLAWPRAPRFVGVASYVALGWVAALFAADFVRALGVRALILVIAGGLAYTVGAVAYSLRRPNPWPRVFGYHEVFHALVVGAAACHFVVIASILG
jgi:hemolysin III